MRKERVSELFEILEHLPYTIVSQLVHLYSALSVPGSRRCAKVTIMGTVAHYLLLINCKEYKNGEKKKVF